MPQLAEDPLIDRLKELGMDFVADVLHGKIRPTRQQSDMLSRGYADPVQLGNQDTLAYRALVKTVQDVNGGLLQILSGKVVPVELEKQ